MGFHKISKKGIPFLHFLYFHFATKPAAFLAFLLYFEERGFITN
jgi:hypothetical protein